ncbi:MAG: peptidylprolyl isomerase [Opitutales bacterium]|nr:peptidylprolyl isomerase [Opitutales bacterium]NRA26029.1 peptidylprolyl isomerase [Opitutales bacterium]
MNAIRSALVWGIFSAFSLTSIFAQTASSTYDRWEERYENGIAAIVEGRIITKEEVRLEMAPIVPQLIRDSRSPQEFNVQVEQLAKEILQSKIDRQLIIKEFFSDEKRQIPRSVIENEFEKMLLREFEGDRRALLEYLDSQNKTMVQYRRELEEDIVVQVMRGEIRRTMAEVSPEQIEEFYRDHKLEFYMESSVHLRQIQLAPYADETPDVLQQNAEKILTEFRQGTDFADLARRYSQDDMRRRGGDWGWIQMSDIREELAAVAFDLKSGDISEPVKLGDRIFILYVEEKRDEMIQPLPEVRERIETFISNTQAREIQQRWMERLRARGYVKYFL